MNITATAVIAAIGAIASICTILGFSAKAVDRWKAKHEKK